MLSTLAQVSAARRRWVHVGLACSAVVSLVWEPVLALHIGAGLALVALGVVHLAQRRRVCSALLSGLVRHRSLRARSGPMAAAYLLLPALTAVMLGSGVWYWLAGHPTRSRWHALSGVVLAVDVLVHTLRRRRRLLDSQVR